MTAEENITTINNKKTINYEVLNTFNIDTSNRANTLSFGYVPQSVTEGQPVSSHGSGYLLTGVNVDYNFAFQFFMGNACAYYRERDSGGYKPWFLIGTRHEYKELTVTSKPSNISTATAECHMFGYFGILAVNLKAASNIAIGSTIDIGISGIKIYIGSGGGGYTGNCLLQGLISYRDITNGTATIRFRVLGDIYYASYDAIIYIPILRN